MPDYATATDVTLAAGGVDRLLQLTDQDTDAQEDSGIVDDAIDEAEAFINSFVRKAGREVPLPAPVPFVIVKLAGRLAVWTLKQRRDALSAADDAVHEQDITWLENLAAGKVDLGVSPAPPASPHNTANASERPASRAVSRENL